MSKRGKTSPACSLRSLTIDLEGLSIIHASSGTLARSVWTLTSIRETPRERGSGKRLSYYVNERL